MRSSSLIHLLVVCALLVGCQGGSTSHGGVDRASVSDGKGLQKVDKLAWKSPVDAAFPVLSVGRTRYAVRKSSFSELDADGKEVSTQKVADPITSPMTVVSGRAYYGSGKSVVAIEFPEGTPIWSSKTDLPVETSVAVSGSLIIAAAGELLALDDETGAQKWSYAGEGKFTGAPAIKGRSAFVASSKGFVYDIDVDTGQPRWSLETTSVFEGVPVSVADDMLVVPGRAGIVWGIFAASGRERWRFPTRGVIGVGAAIHAGRAWIGTEAGDVSSLDIKTGQEVWRMTDLPAVVSAPEWAGGLIYVGCDDGKLVALDAADGAHKWSFQLESEPLGPPLIGDGEMWLADTGGRVYHVK